MAIDVVCYTKMNVTDLQKRINVLAEKYPYIFPEHYFLTKAIEIDEIGNEIPLEFGFDSISGFTMCLNNKKLIIGTSEVADLVKK